MNTKIRYLGIIVWIFYIITESSIVQASYINAVPLINQIQATDPGLPGGVTYPKGLFGSVIAELFDSSGRIYGAFLTNLISGVSTNVLPKWNGSNLVATSISDNGSTTTIGQSTSITQSSWPALNVTGGVKVNGSNWLYLQNNRIYGDNATALYYDSNDSNTTQFILRDTEGTMYGTVHGAGNGAYFGLLDGDGNWSYLSAKDSYTQFKINDSPVMQLDSDNLYSSAQQQQIGYWRTGNRYAYTDYVGDDTYSDYGLRIMRGNAGANSWSELTHRGTGDFIMQAVEAGTLKFRTNGADRMTIAPNTGNIGIGNSPTTDRLSVTGNIATTGDIKANRMCDATGGNCLTFPFSNGLSGTANYMAKFTGTSTIGNSQIIDNGTNVGVGMSPTYKLDINGDTRSTWFRVNTGGGLYSETYGNYFAPWDANYWYMRDNYGMTLQNPSGTMKGMLYFDGPSGGSFGLLANDGNWNFRAWAGGNSELYGTTYANDFRPYIIYDRNDINYYLDPNGTSRTNVLYRTYGFNGPEYDGNDGNYYVDPNGTSRFSTTVADYGEIRNTGTPQLALHKPGVYATYMGLNASNRVSFGGWSAGANAATLEYGMMYDGNDNGYYVDPDNWSRINGLAMIGAYNQNNASPTLTFQDTDNRGASIHVNSNQFYVLSAPAGNNTTGWTANGTYWPLQIDLNSDKAIFGGDIAIPEGNLGIGLLNPETKLHVAGDFLVNNTNTFYAKNNAGINEAWMWPRWSDNIMYTNFGANGWNIRNNSSTSAMFLTNTGGIGIATTTPSEKLEVAGNTKISGIVKATSYCDINGDNCITPTSGGGNSTGKPVLIMGFGNSYTYCTITNTTDRELYCWGRNDNGMNGYKYGGHGAIPKRVGLLHVKQVSEGGSDRFMCAVKEDGNVWCWGYNANGQLGYGDPLNPTNSSGNNGGAIYTYYAPVRTQLSNVSKITTMHDSTCALKNDGTVWCWGYNAYGQLGVGDTSTRYAPVQVSGLSGIVDIASSMDDGSGESVCALKNDGSMWCWGRNTYGQLGIGTPSTYSIGAGCSIFGCTGWYNTTPIRFGGSSFASVQKMLLAGSQAGTICALKTNGELWCAGYNGQGLIGDGSTTDRVNPVRAGGTNLYLQVAAGSSLYTDMCGITTGSQLYCWGYNGTYGRVGVNTQVGNYLSPQLISIPGLVTKVKVSLNRGTDYGEGHTCALNSSNNLYCWGYNGYGNLGVNWPNSYVMAPNQVANGANDYLNGHIVDMWIYGENSTTSTFVKLDNGELWVWGYNGWFAAGDGVDYQKSDDLLVPQQVVIQ